MTEMGLSDAELATRAGLDRTTVHRMRTGRLVPKVPSAAAVAAALGIEPGRLIKRIEVRP